MHKWPLFALLIVGLFFSELLFAQGCAQCVVSDESAALLVENISYKPSINYPVFMILVIRFLLVADFIVLLIELFILRNYKK